MKTTGRSSSKRASSRNYKSQSAKGHNSHQRSMRKKKNKLALVGGIVAAVVLVVGVAVTAYIASLANLVQEPDFTGDPTINETDMVEANELLETTASGMQETIVETNEAGETIVIVKPHETDPNTGETVPTGTIGPSELDLIEAEHNTQTQSFPILSNRNVYNILLIGTDNRSGSMSGRSDTMMILSINKSTRKMHLVSLMRAMYVKIPDRGYSMLNAAFSWGGAKLLVKTVEENFRVDINDYMLINFDGFRQAIDKVGGITIKLTQAEVDFLLTKAPHVNLVEGENQLNGFLALWYARLRKIDSDFTRTGRQRTVIKALVQKASSMSAGQLDRLARQLLPLIKTNMSGSEMVGLAVDGLGYSQYPISQLMLPVSKSFDMMYVRGVQMYRYDAEKNIRKLQDFLYN